MASTSSTGVEIWRFDGRKNFAIWKEMMQDVLIIRRQIEAIRHNNKPTPMTTEEWCSLDEIARSTIRMHLAENVYFNLTKETTTFTLWDNWQRSKSTNNWSSDFSTRCRKTGHKVSKCWSIKRQENGWRLDQSRVKTVLNHSRSGNQINVAES